MGVARSVFAVRYGVLLMTAAVHGWLLYLLWQHQPQVTEREKSERRSTVWLLTLNPPLAPPTPPKRDATSSSAPATVEIPVRKPEPKSEPVVTTAPKQETEQATVPPTDWHEQAAISAKDLAAKLDAKPSHRALDGSNTAETAKPKKRAEFEWRPNLQRFGFTPEGLPYIRLGELCVYVMFIVGCAFGAAPPPNGEMFDGMRDPNVERGSVPSANELP